MRRIYLGRHGQTLDNALHTLTGEPFHKDRKDVHSSDDLRYHAEVCGFSVQDLESITGDDYSAPKPLLVKGLTPLGFVQAEMLGRYMKHFLTPDTVYVASATARTDQTMRHALAQTGIDLDGCIYIRKDTLAEQVPRELFTASPLYGNDERFTKYADRQPTILEVGFQTYNELSGIAESYPGRDIFAVLHGARNACFRKTLSGSELPLVDLHPSNCSVTTIELDSRFMRELFHIENGQLEEIVRKLNT